jgi:hypothetical protein
LDATVDVIDAQATAFKRTWRCIGRLLTSALLTTADLLLPRLHPSRHDERGDEHLDDFAELVASLAADGDHAAVRPGSRRPQLEDFALDVELGARPHRPGPLDLSAGAHDAAGDGESAAHQQSHGDGRRVPTARYEAVKECLLRGLDVEVKRLGVELLRERPDESR